MVQAICVSERRRIRNIDSDSDSASVESVKQPGAILKAVNLHVILDDGKC